MKKILFYSFALLIITACAGNPDAYLLLTDSNKKVGCTDPLANNYLSTALTDDCSCEYNFTSTISTPPNQFTQKVLIEKFTGAWCGWCPDGTDVIKSIEQANPNKIVAVEIHQQDPMELPNLYNYFATLFSSVGNFPFPAALINRVPSIQNSQQLMENRQHWTGNVTSELQKTPAVGLAIETKPSSNAGQEDIMVKIAFKETSNTDMQLVLYLIENKVAYRQNRYYSNGNPGGYITDYEHNHVIRQAILGNEGLTIASCGSKAGSVYTRLLRANLNGFQRDNCEIVAFVINKTNLASPMRVANVQKTKLGTSKNWD